MLTIMNALFHKDFADLKHFKRLLSTTLSRSDSVCTKCLSSFKICVSFNSNRARNVSPLKRFLLDNNLVFH